MFARRLWVTFTVLLLFSTAIGVGSVTAFGGLQSLAWWNRGDQPLSAKLRSAPLSEDVSADTEHVLDLSETSPIQVYLPIRLPDGVQLEAGKRSDGAVCFNVTVPGQPNVGSCGAAVGNDRISGVVAHTRGRPAIYAGLAGDDVVAVTVATDKGAIKAVVRNGAFLALVPKGSRMESWTAVLSDGSTTTGPLWMANARNPLVDE